MTSSSSPALVAFASGVVGLETAALILWAPHFHHDVRAFGALLFLVPALFVADLARRGIRERPVNGWIAFVLAGLLAALLASAVAREQALHPNFLHDVSWPITKGLVDHVGWVLAFCTGAFFLTLVLDVFVMIFAMILADAIDLAAIPLALFVGAIMGLALGQLLCRFVAKIARDLPGGKSP